MEDEIESHKTNGTWELVERPPNRKVIGCKWVYKLKRDSVGKIVRYKARLVAQGYTQQFGVDYNESFSPVVRHTTLRVLLTVASRKGMLLKHFDVKTAYLYGNLNEEIYMKQPPGFVVAGREKLVCRLRKSIYGLKQSARCWNQRLHKVLLDCGFQQGEADPCLYSKLLGSKWVYVVIYVDDILVAAEDDSIIADIHCVLKKQFEITELGDLKSFLGMEIGCEKGVYSLSLQGYITNLTEKYGLLDSKPVKTPMDIGYYKEFGKSKLLEDDGKYRSIVGALLYVAVNGRPDISICMSILGQKVSNPTEADWSAAKRVLKFLYTTRHWKLSFGRKNARLLGYVDADWAGDTATRKSTSGFLFFYGDGLISWCSRKQNCVSLSSMEAEYIALSEACQEVAWIRQLLSDFGDKPEDATVINEDNQGCISFVSAERCSRRSKHIETRRYFVKDLYEKGEIQLKYCPSEENVADLMTKPLGTMKLYQLCSRLGSEFGLTPEVNRKDAR